MSGFIYVRTGRLSLGSACSANGFFHQVTAQTIDFTMLVIVVIALLAIVHKTQPQAISPGKKWVMCASTWVMPLSTSTAAAALHSIAPVGGNWCWISAARPDLQYALAHGWRLAIIFTIALLYAYMCWVVYSRFRTRRQSTIGSPANRSKYGSVSSGTSHVEVKHVSSSLERCNSAGSWLPIQSPGVPRKSQSTPDITLVPRRQIGHINSLYHLSVPSRTQAAKPEPRPEDQETWLQDIFNISRGIGPVPKSLEDSPLGRNSSGSEPDLPIQLPEVIIDRRPLDLFMVRPGASQPGTPTATGTTGPNYHSQCPKVTKSFQVSTDDAQRAPEDASPSGASQTDSKPGPNYHNQCPKVTKSFKVSVGEAKTTSETSSPETAKPGPNYHNQCPKVTRTVDVSTNQVATPPIDNPGNSGPHYHSQCPKVTRTIGVSIDRIENPPLIHNEGPGPNYHNQCPKVTRTVDISTDQAPSPLPGSPGSPGPQYHQLCPKVQRSFGVTIDQKKEQSEAESGPRYHNECPKVTRSVEVSSSQPGPNYHSECPLVKRTVSVSVNPANKTDTNADASPRYHNQCPKVTRSVRISSFAAAARRSSELSVKPLPPPPVKLLPHDFKTETTILTSPMAPPPSPTPGLPPPPWSPAISSPASKVPFKKPALFSKSNWSESSHSSRIPDPVTPWEDAPKSTIASKIKSITKHCRNRLASSTTAQDENDVDGDDNSSNSPSSEREMRRALLLNAYPLAYFILWLPAIVNRFMETEGVQPANSRAMAALQSCTQLIPLANALTFGVNVYLRRRARSRLRPSSGHASPSRP